MKTRQLISTLVIVAALASLAGCQKPVEYQTTETQRRAEPEVIKVQKSDHNYEVQDGWDYGYSAAISKDAQNGGQVAPKILMFKYAGERGGKHQVHSSDGVSFTAIECSAPCEVMKIMTFIDKDYLRDTVQVERIKNQPGTVANSVIDDAINGRLKSYGMGRGKKTFQVWVDEKHGYQEHLVKTVLKQ